MVVFETKNLQTEGFNTVYYHAGEGNPETIIFLHGSGPGANGVSNWKRALEVFGEKYHVIAPDLVGFGETEIPKNTDISFWEWTTLRVKQVLALMDHHNVDKAHLVGNSMGGVISLSALLHTPTRFDRIVLMGSGGGVISKPSTEIVRMTNFFKDPTIEALGNLIRWFVYDESVLGEELDEIIETRYKNLMRPGVRELYPKLFPANPMELLIPPSALRRIKNEVLLIHGYEDQFVSRESSESLFEHLPNAELIFLKECGHWAQIEKADRFTQLVDQFISEKNKEFSLT